MDFNRHTGDHTKPVEKVVSVPLGTGTLTFSVWMSQESANLLTHDDWVAAGKRLRTHVAASTRAAVMSGDYFLPHGLDALRDDAQAAMKNFVYDELRKRNRIIGNERWQVDSLLAGSEYRL